MPFKKIIGLNTGEEKLFDVSIHVEGTYTVSVYARTPEAAENFANVEFSEADFGELEDIDGYAICSYDENGERYDYD